MTDRVTLAILAEMTTQHMVDAYNQLPQVRQVSRFSDATTGRKRLEMALEAGQRKLARVEGQPGVYRVVGLEVVNNTRTTEALERRIASVAEQNPKRVGTASHARFAVYRVGMTINEYIDEVQALQPHISRPKARKDIYHDRDHGYITISD